MNNKPLSEKEFKNNFFISFVKRNLSTIIFVIIGIILVYVAIYIDVILRARSAYLEAEKYMYWYRNPQKKVEYFENKYEQERKQLEKLFSKGKISKEDYELKLELLEFKKQRQIEESSLKYAYIWYKTVIDLFTPPESKWVKLARKKVSEAKELWRKELESKGYKVEDYMIE